MMNVALLLSILAGPGVSLTARSSSTHTCGAIVIITSRMANIFLLTKVIYHLPGQSDHLMSLKLHQLIQQYSSECGSSIYVSQVSVSELNMLLANSKGAFHP
ncbi:hypothetical protein F5050DRAFT_1726078 [Lentinula boryana]|uniref:Uncharacterized protein n=1 Tax=Lentinula boryana TaxID=40481 RepID=A0ABQ8QRP4_9AGAR|nr:hypothetical protein F5050DRAFT_1726078 [Lentinula boryana]